MNSKVTGASLDTKISVAGVVPWGNNAELRELALDAGRAASEKKYKARKSTSSGNSGYTVAGVIRYYADAV
ncbi:MAG: hypothetical protein ACLUD0_18750 [Eubacterium ramulus]